MKRFSVCFLAVLLATGGSLCAVPDSVSWTVDYELRDSVDRTGSRYIRYDSVHPSVLTFVNDDGSVTVCASDQAAKTTYVYEYSAGLVEQRAFSFGNVLDWLGAFTKDGEGNYYFFYGSRAARKDTENMAMVKRSPEGEELKVFRLKANTPRSMDGIRVPFDAGTCRLELSGSMLAVYFAREMFSGHQASYGFVLDKDTFERIDQGAVSNPVRGKDTQMPYVSHSFNQFIVPLEEGFLFADHGDAYPRCFTFAKFQKGGNTKRLDAFKFPGAIGQNATYAEMGGVAKTSTGYIVAGTYGKAQNNPRNLFILTFDEALNACTAPLYLTKYSKEDGHAGHPKIAALEDGRYLLLWERYTFSTQPANQIGRSTTGYLSTHMLIIDGEGKALSDTAELPGVRLNMNDLPRYNRRNGKVYWAVNDRGTVAALDVNDVNASPTLGTSIILYALDPGAANP
ncbi:MAG: hypothetical protein LBS06_05300 [Treponema sp.]|jgi:hypothetical protein|nr:hypothetical protein [Treponema sp.]